jgi:hypothetical protein
MTSASTMTAPAASPRASQVKPRWSEIARETESSC